MTKRLKDSLGTQAKQATAIEKLNKERIRLKQQLIETSFQRKNAEFQLHNTAADAQSLKHELKAKGDMLLALEKERRRLEVDLQKNERTGSRSNLSSAATAIVRPRPRSVSADRLRDKRTQYGKQLLLQSGLTNAYVASKVANVDADDEEAELEKVVMLQKLLLGKSKQVIERDVKIEELQKRSQELIQQLHRLRRARQFAEELTVTRHKLNIRTNQVEVRLRGFHSMLKAFFLGNERGDIETQN